VPSKSAEGRQKGRGKNHYLLSLPYWKLKKKGEGPTACDSADDISGEGKHSSIQRGEQEQCRIISPRGGNRGKRGFPPLILQRGGGEKKGGDSWHLL